MSDMNLNILLSAQNTASTVFQGAFSALDQIAMLSARNLEQSLGRAVLSTRGQAALAAQGVAQSATAIEADTAGAGSAIAGMGVAMAAALGIAAVGVGIASVKMAADFQTAVLSLVAHAGLAQSQVQNVSTAILAMAPTVGRSPIELADALYPILSAFSGITDQAAKSSLALTTLKLSFETVAGTTVNGTAVANAAVGTFNALGLATNNAGVNAQRMTALMDVMDKTVQLGNMTWDQYKNVIAKVATSSNTAGVSFHEASAALATLTSQGMNVQKAGTYLVNTFNTLEIKTNTLATHAQKLGISFDQQKYSSMNLADKIKYLTDITHGNSQELLALMGNNSTALITFKKLSTGVDTYRADLDALNHSQGALASSYATATQGFNFHMEQMKAAGQALLITIGTQLLPVFTKIVAQITPIITRFTAWLVSSGALKNGISLVTGIIGGFIGVIGTLISIGANVVGFFQKNQWAVDLLAAVLITLAGIAMAFVLAAIPPLIAAFIAWAIAAGAAAIATLAAALPFILIGIIIAAVVFGIIMAIQHWGQIVAWLQGVWSAFSSWFGGLMSALGTKVHDIVSGIGGMFSSLGTNLHNTATNIKNGVGQTFSNLGSTLHNTATNIKNGVGNAFSALGTGVVNSFKWMYDHNIYFRDMVMGLRALAHDLQVWLEQTWTAIQTKASAIWNAISTFVIGVWNKISSVATSVWNAISTFLTGIWNTTSSAATSIWNTITTAIENAVTTVWNWLVSIWTTATTWLGNQWNKFTGLAQQAWNAVSGVFASIWNTYIAGPLGNLWNQFTGWFGNLANQAFQWGKNLIQGFINGIGSMFSAVGTAAHNIAQNVWSFLGFQSPAKEGPGSTADQWAPNLMKMYAAGITGGLPALKMAVSAAVQQTTPLNPAASGPLAPTGRGGSGGGSVVHNHHYNMGGITVNAMDRQHTPDELANKVLDAMSRKLRSSGGLVTNTSGGRAF